jgi:predicted kinase
VSTLYVMQGPPGSGKSWMANAIVLYAIDCTIYATDEYHIDADGVYRFKPEMLAEFHARNLQRSCNAMQEGRSVIVDNTNIAAWQAREYVRYAVAHGVAVVFIRVTGTFPNVHGVPQDIMDKMRGAMEDLTVESVLASKTPQEVEAEDYSRGTDYRCDMI